MRHIFQDKMKIISVLQKQLKQPVEILTYRKTLAFVAPARMRSS